MEFVNNYLTMRGEALATVTCHDKYVKWLPNKLMLNLPANSVTVMVMTKQHNVNNKPLTSSSTLIDMHLWLLCYIFVSIK